MKSKNQKSKTSGNLTRDYEINQPLTREFNISESRDSVDEKARTVEVAFSSEQAVERYGYSEVLDHQPQSVRLDRLNNGGAVLVEHDRHDHVGVIENARIDSDRVGRATLRFSKSKRGQSVFDDVKDGIRTLISVGYSVAEWNEKKADGKVTARAVDWTPYEISFVSIPADSSVGVDRSLTENNKEQIETMKDEKPEVIETRSEPVAPAINVKQITEDTRKSELNRINVISQMAEEHDLGELGRQAIDEGTSASAFNQSALKEIGVRNAAARVAQENETGVESGHLGLSNSDKRDFSFVRLMDALANPNDRAAQKAAGHELEVCAEGERTLSSDYKVRGSFIPPEIFTPYNRTLSAGTTTDGAELVSADLMAGSFIDVQRNVMATAKAGAQMLPGLVGTVDIPRKTSASAAAWLSAEDGSAAASEPQFDQVSLSPKDLAAYTEVTRRLLLQSTPAIEGIVRNDLAVAIGLALDLAVLDGSGASGQPTGISAATGINVKDLAAADPTYAEMVEIVKLVMEDNALMGTPSWIIEANGWEALRTTAKQGSGVEGNFILGDNGTIVGFPHQVSNQVTAEEYFFGDFSQVLVGEWGGLEINVDPYTNSLKGRVRYVVFKTADVAIRTPTAFVHAHDGIV